MVMKTLYDPSRYLCDMYARTGGTGTPTGGTPPYITAQPANTTVARLAGASFSVTATTSVGSLLYQWRRNGTNIAGAVSSTYSVPTVMTEYLNTGDKYACLVSNGVGQVLSASATLTVTASGSSPTILTQPNNINIQVGSSASFSLTATGAAPITFQWYKTSSSSSIGAAITGATASVLFFPAAAATDSGFFYCNVSNSYATVKSSVVSLNVASAPPTTFTVTPGVVTIYGAPLNALPIVPIGATTYRPTSVGMATSVSPSNLTGSGTWVNIYDGSGDSSVGTIMQTYSGFPAIPETVRFYGFSGTTYSKVEVHVQGLVLIGMGQTYGYIDIAVYNGSTLVSTLKTYSSSTGETMPQVLSYTGSGSLSTLEVRVTMMAFTSQQFGASYIILSDIRAF